MVYTIIAKIKTTLEQATQEVLDLLGEGARPDAQQEEYFFALNNTPVSNGYCRIRVDEHIAVALDYLMSLGETGEHIECVRAEWQGQDMYPVEQPVLDEEGNPTGEMETVYEERLFQTGTYLDDEGNEHPVYLGRF